MVNQAEKDILQVRNDYISEIELAKKGVNERIEIEKKIHEKNLIYIQRISDATVLLKEFMRLEATKPVLFWEDDQSKKHEVTIKRQKEILDQFGKIMTHQYIDLENKK